MHINPNPCSNAGLGVCTNHSNVDILVCTAESKCASAYPKPNRRLYVLTDLVDNTKLTTFNNGSLGSCNDEERSEMRNVMRFARICESSSL
jgi:hypothetical protein